jgi:pyruvate dehydrogenase E1 component alpha subunit/2-oxoisovalerate dehydrogenase E1 component alpha subunit
MLEARVLEEKLAALYRSGKIVGGVFLGRGQEALSVALGVHLRRGDIYAPLIRDQAGRLAFGDTILDTLRTYLGSSLGPMRGRDGNIHRGRPSEGYHAMISHLGAMVSTVCGGLVARRFRGETGVVGATCIGEGGTSTGSFHEGINMAAVENLPLVVVVANNQYSHMNSVAAGAISAGAGSVGSQAIGALIPKSSGNGGGYQQQPASQQLFVRTSEGGFAPAKISYVQQPDGSYVPSYPRGRQLFRQLPNGSFVPAN